MVLSPFWVITKLDSWHDGMYSWYRVWTDLDCYLVMFWTCDEPGEERLPQRSRGTTERHNVKRYLRNWKEVSQREGGDDFVHTYRLPAPWLYAKTYIRFEGHVLGRPSPSRSPIFETTKPPPFEPWDMGLTGRHPWVDHIFGYGFFEFPGAWLFFSTDYWGWGPQDFTLQLWAPFDPDPIFARVPRYFKDHTLPGVHRTPPNAYIRFTFYPAYFLSWHLQYDWATTFVSDWPRFGPTARRDVIGWGEHTIDLRKHLQELADYNGVTLDPETMGMISIFIEVSWSGSPPTYANIFRQDYLDFIPELPD